MIRSEIRKALLGFERREVTPYYFIDIRAIECAFNNQRDLWIKYFPDVRQAYSYKTNPLSIITRKLFDLGAAAEVVSGPEMFWALEDGFSGSSIVFNGPAKTKSELYDAIKKGVQLNVDSMCEFNAIVQICGDLKCEASISLRVAAPLGGGWSRFGLLVEECRKLISDSYSAPVSIVGLHLHAGSNYKSPSRIIETFSVYADILCSILQQSSERIEVNLGGGLPAQSIGPDGPWAKPEDFPTAVAEFLEVIGVPRERIRISLEPGRSLVEDNGFLITSVVRRKKRNGRSLLFVDAATNLVRSVSTWFHPVEFLSENSISAGHVYAVYGNLCFESDLIASSLIGPEDISPDEKIIVGSAGGYDLPSANLWSRPLPPIWAFDGEETIRVLRNGRISGTDPLDNKN